MEAACCEIRKDTLVCLPEFRLKYDEEAFENTILNLTPNYLRISKQAHKPCDCDIITRGKIYQMQMGFEAE